MTGVTSSFSNKVAQEEGNEILKATSPMFQPDSG
jgi:hypothetical protein